MMAGISDYCLNELPVFQPNEYFWKNYWDGKEEKWVAYARAVSSLMCQAGGFKMSSNKIEDKLEYKKVVRGSIKPK